MNTNGSAASLSVPAIFLTLALFVAGCPLGDCWGTADITVTIERDFAPPTGAQVRVVEVIRIVDSDVTGTSAEGLPIGPRTMNPRILDVTFDPAAGTGHATDQATIPYPTWFYAFVDLNDNRQLDAGESFGTDPKNPSSPPGGFGCRSSHYQGIITINRRLP